MAHGAWRMARRFPAVIVSGYRAWVCPDEEGESCVADARPRGASRVEAAACMVR
jgi:hypothetical protein